MKVFHDSAVMHNTLPTHFYLNLLLVRGYL